MSTGSMKELLKKQKKALHGALGETRTPNLLIRSQILYPVKLRARFLCKKCIITIFLMINLKNLFISLFFFSLFYFTYALYLELVNLQY